jgi:transcriptional regulator of arginine metabolism
MHKCGKECKMPSDREVQAKRREVLVEILTGEEKVSDQRDLVEVLRKRGIPATQSSISRDLKALGAVRTRGYYEIPSWTEEEDEDYVSPFRKAVPFLRKIKQAGPYQLLIATEPGAGRVVSQAINDSEWEDVVGTVDGDSAVLVLTENFFFQRLVYERIKYYVRAEGRAEVIESKEPELEPESE